MKRFRTHYDNLQVAENASPEVIKGAYKYLSQKWHPDRNPTNKEEAERITKIINQAYQVLSDPALRREHDAWIAGQRAEAPSDEGSPPAATTPEREPLKARVDTPPQAEAPTARPWVRFWARSIDLGLFGLVFGGVLGFLFPELIWVLIAPGYELLFGMLILFFWVFVEPLFVSRFSTTPGKWLLRTRIVKRTGETCDYSTCLTRAARVWWRGMAAGIPLVQIVTWILAYRRLYMRRITSWDEEGEFVVVHEKIGVFRVLVSTVILVGLMIVYSI